MSAENASAADPSVVRLHVPLNPPKSWTRRALVLSVAAQLITVSALLGAHPLPHTWSSYLLAVAPVPLALAAALTSPAVARVSAVVAVAALVAGIAGGVAHTGLFFLPALVALVAVARELWGERMA